MSDDKKIFVVGPGVPPDKVAAMLKQLRHEHGDDVILLSQEEAEKLAEKEGRIPPMKDRTMVLKNHYPIEVQYTGIPKSGRQNRRERREQERKNKRKL